MPSPNSTTANIQKALDQALESASATSPVSGFRYTIVKEWPINGVLRTIWVQAFGKGAATDGTTGGGGAPGGFAPFDCSLTASATGVVTRLMAKLKGSGASGPFG